MWEWEKKQSISKIFEWGVELMAIYVKLQSWRSGSEQQLIRLRCNKEILIIGVLKPFLSKQFSFSQQLNKHHASEFIGL